MIAGQQRGAVDGAQIWAYVEHDEIGIKALGRLLRSPPECCEDSEGSRLVLVAQCIGPSGGQFILEAREAKVARDERKPLIKLLIVDRREVTNIKP